MVYSVYNVVENNSLHLHHRMTIKQSINNAGLKLVEITRLQLSK